MEHEHAVALEDELPRGVLAQPDELDRGWDRRHAIAEARSSLVDRNPGRVLDEGKAEDATTCGEVRAQRVRRAHDGAGRNQAQRSSCDPTMLRDVRCVGLQL